MLELSLQAVLSNREAVPRCFLATAGSDMPPGLAHKVEKAAAALLAEYQTLHTRHRQHFGRWEDEVVCQQFPGDNDNQWKHGWWLYPLYVFGERLGAQVSDDAMWCGVMRCDVM